MTETNKYSVDIVENIEPEFEHRLLVGTACTGSVRIEWVQARMGQIIPVNFSLVDYKQYMNGFFPLRYQVADAQNLIVQEAINGNYTWLLLWEHDNCPLPDALIRINRHMRERTAPVVSGLYFTRSMPSEPLIFRGRGTGAYTEWEFGDQVWCDGVPTGFLLIHVPLLRAMWDESECYNVNKAQVARRVFETPRKLQYAPDMSFFNTKTGTSDLEWCTRVIDGGYLAKSGWPEFQDKEYPFLVDTNLFSWHINNDGTKFPLELSARQAIAAMERNGGST